MIEKSKTLLRKVIEEAHSKDIIGVFVLHGKVCL